MLNLTLFGSPEISLNHQPLSGFVSQKVRALLIYLAVTGRAHDRDHLATLLWGDMPASSARANLRAALSNLRRLIGERLEAPGRQPVRLVPGSFESDVSRFRAQVGPAVQGRDPSRLEAVAALYQGDFLAGFAVSDALDFEAWMLAEQEGLRRQVMDALALMADLHAGRGNLRGAIAAIRRILALEPWSEKSHRDLMVLLAQNGERGAALAQFEACRKALAAELDVPPSEETADLYARIRDGEIGAVPGSREPGPVPLIPVEASPSKLRPTLPVPATPFSGRDMELAEIRQMLAQPNCRLLTLIGPGGIGKTRLALEAARQIAGSLTDGAGFVDLQPLASEDGIAPRILEELGISLAGVTDPVAHLLAHLQDTEMLLVLDNFDHLVSGASLIGDLLATAPGLRLLITSRVALNLQEEWLNPVLGLAYPTSPDQGSAGENLPVEAYAALRLFAERARRVRPGFDLAANLAQVIRICRLTEGFPLALELAAPWLKSLSCEEIADELEAGAELLTATLRNLPQRHRSMETVFAQSWQRLSQREQAVFARLAVFPSSFSREAAAAVAGATLPVLQSLIDHSLLRRDGDGRYRMHELLRFYAEEQLHRAGGEHSSRRDHSIYFLDYVVQRTNALQGVGQRAASQQIHAELDNILAGWHWALEHECYDLLAGAVRGVGLFFLHFRSAAEGFALYADCARVLSARDREDALMAEVLIWGSDMANSAGERRWSQAHLPRCLEILDGLDGNQLHIRFLRAFALLVLGGMAWYSDMARAHALLNESLSLAKQVDDRWLLARVHREMGRALWAEGAYRQAYDQGAQSLAIRMELGDEDGAIGSLDISIWSTMKLGWLEQTAAYVQQQRSLEDRLGRPNIQSHFNLGHVWRLRGQYGPAAEASQTSLGLARQDHMGHRVNSCRLLLAHCYLHLGRWETAGSLLDEAVAAAGALALPNHRATALCYLAQFHLTERNGAEAASALAEGYEIAQAVSNPLWLVYYYPLQAHLARNRGDVEGAWRWAAQALDWCLRTEDAELAPEVLALAALLHADAGQADRASSFFAAAYRSPAFARSHWHAHLFSTSGHSWPAPMPAPASATFPPNLTVQDLWDSLIGLQRDLSNLLA